MWNIMKSLAYQIRNDIFSYVVWILVAVLSIAPCFIINGAMDVTASENLLSFSGMAFILVLLVVLFMTARICGFDQNDKTINYEVLSGHKRGEVFFARALMSYLVCIPTLVVAFVLPLAVKTLMNGWGTTVMLADAWKLFGVAMVITLRIVALFIMLTFLLKNCYVTIAVGYLLGIVELFGLLLIKEVFGLSLDMYTSLMNFELQTTLENYRFDYIDGKDVMVYMLPFENADILPIVCSSLIGAVICIVIGYFAYKKRDIA